MNLEVDNDDTGLWDGSLEDEDVPVRGGDPLPQQVPHEEGHKGVPHPLHQPQGYRAPGHAAVPRVLRVQPGSVEKGARRPVLLQHPVDEDGHGGVERVEQEEEEAVEEGLGAVVREEHEEHLAWNQKNGSWISFLHFFFFIPYYRYIYT